MKKVVLVSALALFTPVMAAQTVPGSAPRANAPAASRVSADPSAAPSGMYKLDPRHASVIARVAHGGGTSFSTFRFGTSSGTLAWNGTDPEASKLSVIVDTTSLQTPVPDFASELIGDRFLKTGQFQDSTFVSTAIRRTGPTSGQITGDLTFMGQTKSVVIDAKMVGTAMGRSGPVIGFSGSARFKRSDFGFSTMIGPIGDEVELLLDVEFIRAADR